METHTGIHKETHKYIQTHTQTHKETHADIDIYTRGHTHTGTHNAHRHTRRHADTQGDTQTHAWKNTQGHTHLHTQSHKYRDTHRHGGSKGARAHSVRAPRLCSAARLQHTTSADPAPSQWEEALSNPVAPGGRSCLLKGLPLWWVFFLSLTFCQAQIRMQVWASQGTMEQARNPGVGARQ